MSFLINARRYVSSKIIQSVFARTTLVYNRFAILFLYTEITEIVIPKPSSQFRLI